MSHTKAKQEQAKHSHLTSKMLHSTPQASLQLSPRADNQSLSTIDPQVMTKPQTLASKLSDPVLASFYKTHAYNGTALGTGNPISTGIWSNSTHSPNEYVSSSGLLFTITDPPGRFYSQPPRDYHEATIIQEALTYTRKDYYGWTGQRTGASAYSIDLSYGEQWEQAQQDLVDKWKGPVEDHTSVSTCLKEQTPRLVSVGPFELGVWDFSEPVMREWKEEDPEELIGEKEEPVEPTGNDLDWALVDSKSSDEGEGNGKKK